MRFRKISPSDRRPYRYLISGASAASLLRSSPEAAAGRLEQSRVRAFLVASRQGAYSDIHILKRPNNLTPLPSKSSPAGGTIAFPKKAKISNFSGGWLKGPPPPVYTYLAERFHQIPADTGRTL